MPQVIGWDEGNTRPGDTRQVRRRGGYAGLGMRILFAHVTSEPVGASIVGWIEPVD